MLRLLIIAQGNEALTGLSSELSLNGFACSILSHGNGLMKQIAAQSPDLILVEMADHLVNSRIQELAQRMKPERPLPIIALVAKEKLDSIDSSLDVDDVLISPYGAKELVLRIKRVLHRTSDMNNSETIRCGGLVIDRAKCEVTLEGKLVVLTFKEYELLKFLASNRGRVFTREALLNKVWDYDYYGGDRTIDVHIRRLRSKIDESGYTFIETVRNIGYRFREDM